MRTYIKDAIFISLLAACIGAMPQGARADDTDIDLLARLSAVGVTYGSGSKNTCEDYPDMEWREWSDAVAKRDGAAIGVNATKAMRIMNTKYILIKQDAAFCQQLRDDLAARTVEVGR